jgi:hypothetical protein
MSIMIQLCMNADYCKIFNLNYLCVGVQYKKCVYLKLILNIIVNLQYCCMIYGLTVYGFWIKDWIIWTLWYSMWLHFTGHCYTHMHTRVRAHTHTHTHQCLQSIVTSHRSVAAANGGCSTSSEFLNYPWPQLPASHSNSSQGLNLRPIWAASHK